MTLAYGYSCNARHQVPQHSLMSTKKLKRKRQIIHINYDIERQACTIYIIGHFYYCA